MSNQLIILGTVIPQQHDLFNLKDLHQLSGGKKTHEPYQFIRLDQTQELIKAIEAEGNTAVKTYRGTQGGTYACKEIVIAYAAWISPQFHLVVLRAFLNQLEQQPKQLALPTPEKTFTIECTERELQLMSWLWFIALRGVETMKMIHPAMEKLGSRYSAAIYGQAFEYNHLIRDGHKLIQKLTAKFEYDYESSWRVVKHIRNYNPKGNNSHVI